MKEYTLVGVDGNAFCILAYVKEAMRKEGFSVAEREEYVKKATVADYDTLIVTSLEYLEECNKRLEYRSRV